MARRLKRGAHLVVMHHSFPPEQADKWLERYAAFTNHSGASANSARQVAVMKDKLPVLSPKEDEAILDAAGFEEIDLFYSALTFKGWVCRKA
jgi:tRNA (cmo5U34)-methyltransferase